MQSDLQRLKRDSESGHRTAPLAVRSKEQLSVRIFRLGILAVVLLAAGSWSIEDLVALREAYEQRRAERAAQ
jgi:hypothetical protein